MIIKMALDDFCKRRYGTCLFFKFLMLVFRCFALKLDTGTKTPLACRGGVSDISIRYNHQSPCKLCCIQWCSPLLLFHCNSSWCREQWLGFDVTNSLAYCFRQAWRVPGCRWGWWLHFLHGGQRGPVWLEAFDGADPETSASHCYCGVGACDLGGGSPTDPETGPDWRGTCCMMSTSCAA